MKATYDQQMKCPCISYQPPLSTIECSFVAKDQTFHPRNRLFRQAGQRSLFYLIRQSICAQKAIFGGSYLRSFCQVARRIYLLKQHTSDIVVAEAVSVAPWWFKPGNPSETYTG